MSYQVLARKWRPKIFSEVVGQEHVLRALINALEQKRLHHAYLFTGTRGVGKTTIARILAKCLNCETGITATPCCKCDSCLEIDAGKFMDLIEVDAASRTRVEDTKDLLDNVQYLPAKGRFKVYLIDEVHMLSGHSFNALLKTLEEPPEHVKFLLATTDPQKLPVTVLSRCLQFNLKAVNPEVIQQQLAKVLTAENINFETSAIQLLANAAQGSVRDSLSLLDQAIAFGQSQVLTSDVAAMLGTVEQTKVLQLLIALANKDATNLLNTCTELAELATDFTDILEEVLQLLHQITLIQLVPSIDVASWNNNTLLRQLASKFTPDATQLYYQIGIKGKQDLPLAPTPRIGFEMIMFRMLAFDLETGSVPPIVEPMAKTSATNVNINIAPKAAAVATKFNPVQENAQNLSLNSTSSFAVNTNLLKQIQVTGPTRALLDHCVVKSCINDQIELLLDPAQAPLLNKKHEDRLSQAFSVHFQKPIIATISIGNANMPTNALNAKEEFTQKNALAINQIADDPQLKEILTKFDAKIIPNSVKYQEN